LGHEDKSIPKVFSNDFKNVIKSFGLAISVYIGFYLGFVIQQVDRVGQATLVIQVNNATTEVASWVNQANQSVNDFLPQTMLYVALLVPVLLKHAKPTFDTLSGFLTSILFPVLFVVSWLALPAATLPASIPQPFLSISMSGLSGEVNLAVLQIFTFLEFDQSFVLALNTLAVMTAFWGSTRLIGKWTRDILPNALVILSPLPIWLAINLWLQARTITLSPGPTSNLIVQPVGGGGGCIGSCLLQPLQTLSDAVIVIAIGIWVVSALNFMKETRSAKKGIAPKAQK
jgi:lipid-A-disaccharide synthase-like uncharacterized protein